VTEYCVYGALPGLFHPGTAGPMVREAQRHLAGWQLQPVTKLIGAEMSGRLDSLVRLDAVQPLQAFAAGGRAITVTAIVQALAMAKESAVDPEQPRSC
jgi:hypothetical protein